MRRFYAALALVATLFSGTASADLLFIESFDHLTTSTITRKWSSGLNTSIGTGGQNGTNAWRSTNYDNRRLGVTLSPSTTTGVVGFALNLVSTPPTLASIFNVQDTAGARQLSLSMNSAGTFTIRRGGYNGTVLTTASTSLSISTYNYIEWKFHIDNAGSTSLRINGVEVATYTGDTQNTANNNWGPVQLGPNSEDFGSGFYADDLYVLDSNGSTNNNFLGPIRIKAIYADGAGNSTDFTPSAGSNFQNVDEATVDDDTTYNSETTTGDHDTYTFGAVGLTGTVLGVQVNLHARSAGVGGELIRPTIRIGSTDYNGTSRAVTTSYSNYRQLFQVSPATSTAWTIAEIDGAEFGVELVP